MDRRKIRVTYLTAAGFSKAALTYDEAAWLQRQMWDELLKRIKSLRPKARYIVDIGTATGEHAHELAKLYPRALTAGFDISWEMVRYAAVRQRRFQNGPFLLQADLNEMPFKVGSFDIAVSNVVYQRVRHLDQAFLEARRIIRPKGLFCFSLMTKNTLRELHRSFEKAYKRVRGPQLPQAHRHPSASTVIASLKKAGFSIIGVRKFRKRPAYNSTYEILKWIKDVGANHHYENWIDGIEGRAVLNEMERIYREDYSSKGKIFATFEGLIISARRRG